MITGQIKNQIDQIWDTFWTGGISNFIDILEQMTYGKVIFKKHILAGVITINIYYK